MLFRSPVAAVSLAGGRWWMSCGQIRWWAVSCRRRGGEPGKRLSERLGLRLSRSFALPKPGSGVPRGRLRHWKFDLRVGDRRYATQGGCGAITLVECCGGESRACNRTVRVEVMTSGNSRMRWVFDLSSARETGGAESGLQVGLRLCGRGRVLKTLEIRKLITSCHTY